MPRRSLVSTFNRSPSAPPEPAAQLISVDDTLIAWGEGGGWRLSQDEKSWQRFERPVTGAVLSVAGDGHAAYLLIGAAQAGPAERVEPLFLNNLSRHCLHCRCRSSVRERRCSALECLDRGFDEGGSPRFFEIDTSAARPQWTTHDAWTGPSGAVTSAVEQTGAVLVTVRAGDGPDRLLQWKASEGWRDRGTAPTVLVPGTGSPIGQAHVLYLASGESPH